MKGTINEKVTVPEGVTINLEGNTITLQGEKGTLTRTFTYPAVDLTKENNSITLRSEGATLREKRMIKTYKAHLKNMIAGVSEGYIYELKICSGHFPMNVSIEGNKKLIIKNFLGEKVPREARIDEGVTVTIEGEKILCEGADKEAVGRTAGRIEKATMIKGRDRRVFQDGIYITTKARSAAA